MGVHPIPSADSSGESVWRAELLLVSWCISVGSGIFKLSETVNIWKLFPCKHTALFQFSVLIEASMAFKNAVLFLEIRKGESELRELAAMLSLLFCNARSLVECESSPLCPAFPPCLAPWWWRTCFLEWLASWFRTVPWCRLFCLGMSFLYSFIC